MHSALFARQLTGGRGAHWHTRAEQAVMRLSWARQGGASKPVKSLPAAVWCCRGFNTLWHAVLAQRSGAATWQEWLMLYYLVQCCASHTCQSSAAARRAPAPSRSPRLMACMAHRLSAPSTTWCVTSPKLAYVCTCVLCRQPAPARTGSERCISATSNALSSVCNTTARSFLCASGSQPVYAPAHCHLCQTVLQCLPQHSAKYYGR